MLVPQVQCFAHDPPNPFQQHQVYGYLLDMAYEAAKHPGRECCVVISCVDGLQRTGGGPERRQTCTCCVWLSYAALALP